jgi:hypothetical protein
LLHCPHPGAVTYGGLWQARADLGHIIKTNQQANVQVTTNGLAALSNYVNVRVLMLCLILHLSSMQQANFAWISQL